ncbi:MAG: hypothetical protein IPN05_03680 [Sulfuritalea sp.]|nr:hypothetical protein [Sulfuritalea sp.]
MFSADMPNVPPQGAPMVLVQPAASSAGKHTPAPSNRQADYLLKWCQEFSSGGGDWVDPVGMVAIQVGNRNNRDLFSSTTTGNAIKITLMEGPTHGNLIFKPSESGRANYMYMPSPGYIGKDTAVFIAEFEGKRYKAVISLVVSEQVIENPPTSDMVPICFQPQLIRLKHK